MWGFFFGHNQCCIILFYILTDDEGNTKITSTLLHCCDLTMEGLIQALAKPPYFGIWYCCGDFSVFQLVQFKSRSAENVQKSYRCSYLLLKLTVFICLF
jgi:hypothetical protein